MSTREIHGHAYTAVGSLVSCPPLIRGDGAKTSHHRSWHTHNTPPAPWHLLLLRFSNRNEYKKKLFRKKAKIIFNNSLVANWGWEFWHTGSCLSVWSYSVSPLWCHRNHYSTEEEKSTSFMNNACTQCTCIQNTKSNCTVPSYSV